MAAGSPFDIWVEYFWVPDSGMVPQRATCCPCYITTAACTALGLPDECEELQTLRWFRDNVLTDEAGLALVGRYYEQAPAIVRAIDA